MTDTIPRKRCVFGALNHTALVEEFQPLHRKATRSGQSEEAAAALRALLVRHGGTPPTSVQEQIDKLLNAVQSQRWLRAPAGVLIEHLYIDGDAREATDHFEDFDAAAEFFFRWDEERTARLLGFFSTLSEHTLPWASHGDTWRAALPHEAVRDASAAMNELTRRDVQRLLADAEGGGVFSEDEANAFADWWDHLRAVLRVAKRSELGFYLCIRPAPSSA
ncbi:MAG: hypothetical protein EA398_00400 [Deltaproteobacteria bacterium]|nr:MAG: hypothetical protein EA398_00400 [Deltaproteobacteria bacterium]